MEPSTFTRTIELATDSDAAWSLVGTGEGLARWLADEVDLDVVPGAVGRIIDDYGSPARTVVVSEVKDGRQLGFTWWSEEDPDVASSVVITVEPSTTPGTTTLTVTETRAPSTAKLRGSIGATADLLAEASVDQLMTDLAWGRRLRAIVDVSNGVLVGA